MAPKKTQVDLDTLPESVGSIFDQVQHSLANHKKNSVALYKLHIAASNVTQPTQDGGVKMVGEKKFENVFIDMVNRVLVVKKGPVTADRVVKFVGGYVKYMNERVADEKAKQASSASISASKGKGDMDEEEEEDEDSFATRFVSKLLGWLFQGFEAKNKNVRYRSVFIVSEMMAYIGEIDEDTYTDLREILLQRIWDKEPLIRAYAIIALSKLIGSEDPNEVVQGEKTILQVILETLTSDPAAEVRRAALISVPLVPTTLPTILTRTRDTDIAMRKLVYSSVLAPKLSHPRQLTISQREQIVKDGLGDREPVVRVATGKLLTSWFDTILAETAQEAAKHGQGEEVRWEGDDSGVMRGLVAFLGLFDVVGPGEAVAADAVLSIFVNKPEIPDVFVFSEEFWASLTPESAVLARIFVEHSINTEQEARLESACIPVVTAFAFHIQEAYNLLLQALQEAEAVLVENGETNEEVEEEMAKQEVMLGELLRIALKLDYGDEIGRRKVFSVVRDILAHPQLPPGLIEKCLDVLKEIMPSERDLIRLVVEIIVELRDDNGDLHEHTVIVDETKDNISQGPSLRRELSIRRKKERHRMSEEERVEADTTDIRCLMLCIAVLERMNGSFEDNSTLEGILADLIIPSVKRKELVMREKALISLGLCCLIAKNMALSSFQLFVSQVQSAPDELRVQVLRIILDLLFMYDHELFGKSDDIAMRIINFLLHTLEAEEYAPAQAVLCTGICKLLLAGIVKDSRILTALVLTYVAPSTVDNLEARQCLSYFFPVYCYSSPDNQKRMQSVFMAGFDLMTRMYEEHDDSQDMITPYQFGLQMVDWTNPTKAGEIQPGDRRHAPEIHVELGVDIMTALYDSDRTEEDQKVLCQLLNQLTFPAAAPQRSLHKLDILLRYHEQQCPFDNQNVMKLFSRFKQRFQTVYQKELEKVDPRRYHDDEFHQLYEYIAVDMPDAGIGADEPVEDPKVPENSADNVEDEEQMLRDHTSAADDYVSAAEDVDDAGNGTHDAAQTAERAQSSDHETEKAANEDSLDEQKISKSPISEESSEEEERKLTASRSQKQSNSKKEHRSKGLGKTASKQRGKHAQQPTLSSSEESVHEADSSSQSEVAPSPKKRGVKRVHSLDTGLLKSPSKRKRNRTQNPRKLALESYGESSSTKRPSQPAPNRKTRHKYPADNSDEESEENTQQTVLPDTDTSGDLAGYSD